MKPLPDRFLHPSLVWMFLRSFVPFLIFACLLFQPSVSLSLLESGSVVEFSRTYFTPYLIAFTSPRPELVWRGGGGAGGMVCSHSHFSVPGNLAGTAQERVSVGFCTDFVGKAATCLLFAIV